MDDEKFFEALVNEKASADADFSASGGAGAFGGEVKLAKAEVPSKTSAGTKKSAAHKEERGSPPAAKESYDDEPEGQLAIDVYQTPSEIIVESAIAGVHPEDIDINVTNDSIVIKGERRREEKIKDDDYYYQECYWGKFSRSVILPQEVDPESAEVTFKNGILTARLPKVNRKKSRKLKVKVE